MFKFRAIFWDKNTKSNQEVGFEASAATFADVRTRMSNRNPTEAETVEAFCSELTRSMGGRTVHKVERA